MPHKGLKYKLHYTDEDIEKPVKKVRTGRLSYRRAYQIYGVPKSTISDKIHRHYVKLNSNKPGQSAIYRLKLKNAYTNGC